MFTEQSGVCLWCWHERSSLIPSRLLTLLFGTLELGCMFLYHIEELLPWVDSLCPT